MSLLLIRELTNNFRLALDVAMLLVIVLHLHRKRRECGSWAKVMAKPGPPLAIVLFGWMFGHTIERAWSAYLYERVEVMPLADVLALESDYPIGLFAGILTAAFILAAVRYYSRDAYGERFWIASLAVSVAFVTMTLIV
jgi:hypothetical protein